MTTATGVDYEDIQGLVRFGYAHMPEACFLLLRIADPAGAAAWLRSVPVTTAVRAEPRPTKALQIAFTCEGMRALGLSEEAARKFSPELVRGIAERSRSRRLGDVRANDPIGWKWGGPTTPTPHVLVMLYAERDLAAWRRGIENDLQGAFTVLTCLETSDLNGREHFGFADGLSQPELDWRVRGGPGGDQSRYRNVVALGEVLLGYPNEYGKYTDQSLLSSEEDLANHRIAGPDAPGLQKLGYNGTYLVLRQLEQDVRAFWRFLDGQAGSNGRKRLAEVIVGRTLDGEPLVPISGRPIAGVNDTINQFTYERDAIGARCPLGAHVRRANPRTADFPPGATWLSRLANTLGFGPGGRQDLVASSRFHRVVRRGRPYGAPLSVRQALALEQEANEPRGLHFMCLCANLARQFEFIQSAWISGTKFDGLTLESDPLLGNREPLHGCPVTDAFSIPQESGACRRLFSLPRFVTVRGGAYFFLPGIRTLQYLAHGCGR